MKLPERVLFVGAHCDDIELLAGGTLHALLRAGRTVDVLVLSDHRGVVAEPQAAAARAELAENLRWLSEVTGAPVVNHSAEAPEGWLPACQGAFEARRAEIYGHFERLRERYDLVITHPPTDTNQDHQQVAREAIRALKGHTSLLGGEFPANDLGDFRAQVLVPLTRADVDAKVTLVQRYGSWRFGGRPYFREDALRGLAASRGAQIRAEAAEAFMVTGRLRLDL